MINTLTELDNLWDGQNIDKASLKLLCRKYGPKIILEWVHRGLTLQKELTIDWHKDKLIELGAPIVEPEALPQEGENNLAPEEEFGDYFS